MKTVFRKVDVSRLEAEYFVALMRELPAIASSGEAWRRKWEQIAKEMREAENR